MQKSMIAGLWFVLVSMGSIQAAPKTYEVYPYDASGFERHPDLHNEWAALREKWTGKIAPQDALKRQYDLMATLSGREPHWIDGYWIAADAAFQYGNSFKDKSDFPIARASFAKGKAFAENCLKIRPDNPLCKFYLGVNLGKIASIDGIFSSLKNAKIVEKMWIETIESRYQHKFGPNTSLQGAARYALGIFYRLVPDLVLLKWLFGVKGDLSKSVAFHKEALEFDAPNVCSRTMLAVAYICEGKNDFTTPSGKLGFAQLQEARKLPVSSALYASCAKDLPRLEQNPKLACGYETSRQQETSEEEFKKQQDQGK
ncbi:MAG TPA: hypothetical protein VE954_23045 [Oligoflexus sp.]|uniref:hypothetical protein n=1 Tax=Oligoflexus sp. TaxID=1971216 RepID=UPI002D525F35|nr:hypothetical protein [Oligoflexus sp.]HYX35989.1 hypothetical protein [Oligoflexus sp.]